MTTTATLTQTQVVAIDDTTIQVVAVTAPSLQTVSVGVQGPTGPGVATGGTTGQVLTKNSSTNYDTSWQTPSGAVSSVFSRTGAITAQTGDYSIGQISGAATVASTGAYGDLSGKPTIPTTTSQLTNNSGFLTAIPNPTLSTLGGVQALNAVAHKFVTALSTLGVLSLAQPATADLSDIGTFNLNTSGTVAGSNLSGTNTGNVTLAGQNYLTLSGQQITAAAIDLSGTNATGTLAAARFPALTGDLTSTAGSLATTLATVNTNTGSFGSSTAIPAFTVNGKGLITAASTAAVIAPAGTLTGTTLASNVVTSSLTSVGTIASGTWSGTTIAIAKGGTGQTTANASLNALLPTQTSNSGKFLKTDGTNTSWAAVPSPGGSHYGVQTNDGAGGFFADSYFQYIPLAGGGPYVVINGAAANYPLNVGYASYGTAVGLYNASTSYYTHTFGADGTGNGRLQINNYLGSQSILLDSGGASVFANQQFGISGITYTWPGSNGTGALTNDGSGNLYWTMSSGGSPGGSTNDVQWNNAGSFAGSGGNFTYDGQTVYAKSGGTTSQAFLAQGAVGQAGYVPVIGVLRSYDSYPIAGIFDNGYALFYSGVDTYGPINVGNNQGVSALYFTDTPHTGPYIDTSLFGVRTRSASNVGWTIRGESGQSADLLQCQDSFGFNKFSVSAGGDINATGYIGGSNGLNLIGGSAITLGTSGNTFQWGTNTSGPSTAGTAPSFTDYFGSSSNTALASPYAWALANVGGTDYKIPLYL